MNPAKEKYRKRLIDDKLSRYLNVFGAVSIEGPKWCGKTWTSLNHCNSAIYLDETEENYNTRAKAEIDVGLILGEDYPELIDEWGRIPAVWDAVRHRCDMDKIKGKYILTESTTIRDKSKIHHSGAGRIDRLKMYSMSLYESGDSTGEISLTDMFEGKKVCKTVKIKPTYEGLAKLIVRGGWPENISTDDNDLHILPQSYINAVLESDISKDGVLRDKNKMRMLLKSLARSESTVVSNNTLIRDIEEVATDEEYTVSRNTIADYIKVLDSLYLTSNQEAYSINYRSSKRIGKSAKRHLVDPSLSCALLGLSVDKLMHDFNTFGLMFEALVERDLRIYMDYLDGHLYHFRDNTSGDEVDAILEFKDGEYAAIEIKLNYRSIDSAKESLLKFYNNVSKKPKFMCIIVGNYSAIIKDEETGIYIIPITALKP